MLKKHQIIIIIIILFTLLLIAIVTWLFDIRIHRIEEKSKPAVVSVFVSMFPTRKIAAMFKEMLL